jgi:hypothetical protein
MEKEEKIAFVKKEIEQIDYNVKTYESLVKSNEDAMNSWKNKIEQELKRKEILQDSLSAYIVL